MPLHTDEINSNYTIQRILADNCHVMTLLLQCNGVENFSGQLPLIWYPHALVTDLLSMHVDHPIGIRVVCMRRFTLFLLARWFVIQPLARHLGNTH